MTAAPTMTLVGTGVGRVEGLDKVTGRARYAAEFPFAELAYGWIVQSTIVRGSIASIDVDSVLAMPGVIAVLTHANAPALADIDLPDLRLLQDNRVHHRGQVVALVVADSKENARAAAAALEVTYETEPHDVILAPGAEDFGRAEGRPMPRRPRSTGPSRRRRSPSTRRTPRRRSTTTRWSRTPPPRSGATDG